MSTHRYDAKRDANEKIIIKRLRELGCTVVQISKKDVCDLIVGFQGVNYMMEVKSERGKLSPGQQTFCDKWRGKKVVVVHTAEEALNELGIKI